MNVVIIDDELHAQETLEILLSRNFKDINIIGKANGVVSGIKTIAKHKPDVVFLDISMPDGSGFDILDILGQTNFIVVFVTAYEKHAIEAIKHNAFDYIMKPIQLSELIKCVHQLKIKLDAGSNNWRISVSTKDAIYFLPLDEIMYFKSEDSYCHVYTSDNNSYFFSKQLKDVESQLPSQQFMRCHNRHIVNKKFVSRLDKSDGGSLILEDDTQLPISRNKKNDFIHWLSS